jgi:hypothetical protein
MAVSSSQSALLTVDGYILDAYKRAGLIPIEFSIGGDSQWNARAAHGRRLLNRVVEDLANERLFDQWVSFEVVSLTAGDGTYSMDSEILNIIDNGSYIPAYNAAEVEETQGETPVSPISVHVWNSLATKNAEGNPTKYYLDRRAMEIHLWPLPVEAGKIRFRVLRIPGSNDTGSDNVDVKRHWGKWLVNALAYEIMSDVKMPMEERVLVRKDRDENLEKIKTFETSNEPPDVIFMHSTGWSGMGG